MNLSPINPNDALGITHAFYAGTTGSCKSVATQKMGLIKANDQVAFWDLYGQYKDKEFIGRKVRTYSTLKGFLMAMYKGRKTKQGFKIAFTPNNPPKDKTSIRKLFLKACGIVWGMGDGLHKKTLHFVAEEINRVTISSGDEDSIYGEILEAGRKFNIMCHSVSQRLAPIPNTVIAMSGYKWIGRQNQVGDAERVAKEMQLKPADIMSLKKFEDKKGVHHEYYFKSDGFNSTVRGEFVFKNAA